MGTAGARWIPPRSDLASLLQPDVPSCWSGGAAGTAQPERAGVWRTPRLGQVSSRSVSIPAPAPAGSILLSRKEGGAGSGPALPHPQDTVPKPCAGRLQADLPAPALLLSERSSQRSLQHELTGYGPASHMGKLGQATPPHCLTLCWHRNRAPCPSPTRVLPITPSPARHNWDTAGTTTRRASAGQDAGLEADKEQEGELRARHCRADSAGHGRARAGEDQGAPGCAMSSPSHPLQEFQNHGRCRRGQGRQGTRESSTPNAS